MDVHWTRDIPGITPPPHLQDLVVQGY
jgi:hypothetical protein